ncbi:unnamed protein product [Ilex paraguariensis]|uniref:Uncharacterized protein n=1 Tax=Ilex paraguariensis TaxID=185542 RepID=A0ABC8RG35_9AQUA
MARIHKTIGSGDPKPRDVDRPRESRLRKTPVKGSQQIANFKAKYFIPVSVTMIELMPFYTKAITEGGSVYPSQRPMAAKNLGPDGSSIQSAVGTLRVPSCQQPQRTSPRIPLAPPIHNGQDQGVVHPQEDLEQEIRVKGTP